MNGFIMWLNEYGQCWFDMMSTAVVQSSFLMVVAVAIGILPAKLPAAFRFWIWQFVALKFLLLPFSMLIVVLPVLEPLARHATNHELLPYTVTYPDSQLETSNAIVKPTYVAVLFGAWLVIVAMQLAYCIRRGVKITRLLRKCTPASSVDTQRVNRLAKSFNLRRTVTLRTGDVTVPFVAGIFRPTIVLPRKHAMEHQRFDQVVLHELTHVKRNDLLWVWIPELARMFFFFHPLVYWIQFQANLCREMACDESVLRSGASRRAYAQTLLDLAGAKPVTT